ncbi:hypothetical protein FRC02_006220 [Tulasnella sp. 418]|nr:hypothetical protein FRC02_006220 [Tulasnella sp. 418]
MTFTILRHQLASIVGHIVHHFQQIRPHTHYSEVLQLDDKLMSFLNTLPPHYSLEPDTSLDEVKSFIPVHRFLIITEVFFTRISLNRPYILRKLDSDKFLPSRRACIDSAKRDFLIRQAFKRTSSKCVLEAVGGSYREFQSAMISGIALAIDPFGPDAPAMHEILDVFLSERELLASKQGKELDETTKREMKIIEFLSMKAKNSELRKGPSQRQNSMNGEAEDEEDGLRSSGEQQSAERSSLMLRRAQGNVTRSSFGSQDAANANLLLGLGQDHRALPKLDVGRLSNGVPPPLGSPSLNTVIGSSSSTTTSFVGTHSRTPSNAVSRTGGNNVGSPMSHITPVATPSPKFPPTNAATNNPSILSPSWVRLNPPASNLGSPRINGVNHSSSSQTHPSSNLSHQRHVPESLASNSPAASAEEEAAQKLLDNWCNSNMDGGQGVGLSGFETGFGPFMGGNGASMMPLWNGNIGLGGSLNLSAGVADPRFGGSGGGLGLLGTTATTTAAPTPSSTTDVPQLNGMGSIANGDVATGIGDVPDWSYWENLVQHIRASGGMS